MIKLDYTLESPEERKLVVQQILEETPEPTPHYLEILADYLILCMEKQERKKKKILTDNRSTTINKRETSFEGLASQLENGEDGIYNLVNEDKNQIFQPKITITKKDLEDIPLLNQLKETITLWETKLKETRGTKTAYLIKKSIIEMRKDQYLIKDAYRRPIIPKATMRSRVPVALNSTEWHDGTNLTYSGISLLDFKVCSIILHNYSKLKQEADGHFDSDLYYLLESFDDITTKALADQPIYEQIVIYKVDGLANQDVSTKIQLDFGVKHTAEYISSLWCNKIPKMIAMEAEKQWLDWYYLNIKKGKYKKCSRCGQIKLADNRYFSKNKTSKDSFYSICKKCRNRKKEKR